METAGRIVVKSRIDVSFPIDDAAGDELFLLFDGSALIQLGDVIGEGGGIAEFLGLARIVSERRGLVDVEGVVGERSVDGGIVEMAVFGFEEADLSGELAALFLDSGEAIFGAEEGTLHAVAVTTDPLDVAAGTRLRKGALIVCIHGKGDEVGVVLGAGERGGVEVLAVEAAFVVSLGEGQAVEGARIDFEGVGAMDQPEGIADELDQLFLAGTDGAVREDDAGMMLLVSGQVVGVEDEELAGDAVAVSVHAGAGLAFGSTRSGGLTGVLAILGGALFGS